MSTALSPPDPLPRAFGRYQLFDRIGVGGMAQIYLARARTELGGARLVVVKQILPELSDNERFASMLVQEAKLAAGLSHANVVQVFDLGREQNVLYIAMEYVEGFDLNELLRRCARSQVPLPIPFALLIVVETLRGLDYAHRRITEHGSPLGLVHRDVSPSNVLISFEGEVKLCDFGIARANDMADLLPEEVIRGKAGYMSPEQARGEGLDARADVFAAGIILWELLAGRKLYRARGDDAGLLEQARAALVPALPMRQLSFEAELHAIASRALAPNRTERYPTAQTMLRELEDYIAQSRLVASPIRFGEWMRQSFGADLMQSRRSRERAAKAMELGPMAVLEPYGTPPPPPVVRVEQRSGEYENPLPRPVAAPRPEPPLSRSRERHLAVSGGWLPVPDARRIAARLLVWGLGFVLVMAAIVLLALRR